MKSNKIAVIADRGDVLLSELVAAAAAIDAAQAAVDHGAEAEAVTRVATAAAGLRELARTRIRQPAAAVRWLLALRGLADLIQSALVAARDRVASGERFAFTDAERVAIGAAIARLGNIS